jgi:hypothetical protein
MDCLICANLTRAYAVGLRDYIDARSSAFYLVSKRLADRKNVDMERARYELEEHRRLRCVSAATVIAFSPEKDVPSSSRGLAA